MTNTKANTDIPYTLKDEDPSIYSCSSIEGKELWVLKPGKIPKEATSVIASIRQKMATGDFEIFSTKFSCLHTRRSDCEVDEDMLNHFSHYAEDMAKLIANEIGVNVPSDLTGYLCEKWEPESKDEGYKCVFSFLVLLRAKRAKGRSFLFTHLADVPLCVVREA